jgi:DNA mismatch endonuclease (patch repair protein)
MMSGIRGKDTKPEMIVRKALFSSGFRYRLHSRDLPGAPDIVMPGRKIAIFVHGCFWHMHTNCKFAKLPSSRTEFWSVKLNGNAIRDQRAIKSLQSSGWRVLVVWECVTRDAHALDNLAESLKRWIESSTQFGEIRLLESYLTPKNRKALN